jgi:hypothetical protein
MGKASYNFQTRALDAGMSCGGEGILTGLWPTGFKAVRRMESRKKKILGISTF